MVIAQLDHLIGPPSLSQCTPLWKAVLYPVQLVAFELLLLLPVSQTSYKQVSKWLAKSLSNGENMNNFPALNTCASKTAAVTIDHAQIA